MLSQAHRSKSLLISLSARSESGPCSFEKRTEISCFLEGYLKSVVQRCLISRATVHLNNTGQKSPGSNYKKKKKKGILRSSQIMEKKMCSLRKHGAKWMVKNLMEVTCYLGYVVAGRNILRLGAAWRDMEQKYTFLFSLYTTSKKYLSSFLIYFFQSEWQELLPEIKRSNNEGVIWSFKISTYTIQMSFCQKSLLL